MEASHSNWSYSRANLCFNGLKSCVADIHFFVATFPPVDFFLINWCGGVQWDPSAVVTTCVLWVHTDDKRQSMAKHDAASNVQRSSLGLFGFG